MVMQLSRQGQSKELRIVASPSCNKVRSSRRQSIFLSSRTVGGYYLDNMVKHCGAAQLSRQMLRPGDIQIKI